MVSILKRARFWLCLSGLVVIATTNAPTALASIQMPEMPNFQLEGRGDHSMGETPVPCREIPNEDPEGQSEHLLPLGNTSTSTSTTSGGGAVPSNATLLDETSNVVSCDPAVIAWVSGESRLVLPAPPGNDLLRPPQVD